MNAVDLQKTFLGKSGNSVGGSLNIASEGIPDYLLQEDNVLYVALKTLAQKKAHLKWCWFIIATGQSQGHYQHVPLPNLKIEIVRCTSKKEKRKLYRSANVFIAHKGLGREAIEAMRVGVPVVQMNHFRLDSIIEDGKNCLHVPMNNSKAIALALERVLVDTDLADHLRVGGTLAACTASYFTDQNATFVQMNPFESAASSERKDRSLSSKLVPLTYSPIDQEKF
ncbi:MAG TPA: glycosyltransferase [Bacteroidota bacterium]|nr:glycosyltransferase [Bacteroidota bacterium]